MWGVRSGGKQAHSLVYDIVGIHTIRHYLGTSGTLACVPANTISPRVGMRIAEARG